MIGDRLKGHKEYVCKELFLLLIPELSDAYRSGAFCSPSACDCYDLPSFNLVKHSDKGSVKFCLCNSFKKSVHTKVQCTISE